jgi:hypothetical protein
MNKYDITDDELQEKINKLSTWKKILITIQIILFFIIEKHKKRDPEKDGEQFRKWFSKEWNNNFGRRN